MNSMKNILIFFSVLIISSCAIQSSKTSNPEKINSIFSFSEKYVGLEQNNTYQWLGIPYAQPPVGSLRWKAPRILESDTKNFKATKFGNACPQRESVSIEKKLSLIHI